MASLSLDRFPLSSTSIPEKAGHCRAEIVRNYDNSSAGLGEINENSRRIHEEGVKRERDETSPETDIPTAGRGGERGFG